MKILPTRYLSRARDKYSIVELHRKKLEPDALCGIVLDFSATLILLHILNEEIRLDGYTVIRRRDVSSFGVAEHAEFYSKVLKLRRLAPKRVRRVTLDSVRALVTSASRHFPLITIHPERKDPDICYIGVPQQITDTMLDLKCIGPGAQWDPDPFRCLLNSITKIDFGGGYEEALAIASGTTVKAKKTRR